VIDSVAKRAAALHSGFAKATLTPSGTIDQIGRGYTLGLYTFTYVATNVPIWTIDFTTTGQRTSCELSVSQTSSLLDWQIPLPAIGAGEGFLVNSSGDYLVTSTGDYLIADV